MKTLPSRTLPTAGGLSAFFRTIGFRTRAMVSAFTCRVPLAGLTAAERAIGGTLGTSKACAALHEALREQAHRLAGEVSRFRLPALA